MTIEDNDFLRALTGRSLNRVPFQEPEVSAHHVDATLGKSIGLLSTHLSPSDYVEFTLSSGQSALYYNANWAPGRVYRPDGSGRMHYVGGRVRSISDLPQLEPFDMDQALRRTADLIDAAVPHGLAVIISFPPPCRLALFSVGYEEFFIRLYDQPDFVRAVIDHFQRQAEDYLAQLLRLPFHAFLLSGTICSRSGPMISPPMIREYWLPSTEQFVKPVAQKGMPIVLHMDGDFSNIVDCLLELPISGIHPFEVTGRLDIYDFKSRYGDRVTVWGNIDLSSTLVFGSPEEVAEDARRHLDRLSPGGRYILGSSHQIPEEVPLENFAALVRAAREYGC